MTMEMASEERVQGDESGQRKSGSRTTQGEDAEGWSAAGRQRARKAQGKGPTVRRLPVQEPHDGVPEGNKGQRQQSRTGMPAGTAQRGGSYSMAGRGKDIGDGHAVFKQLQLYLSKGAPAQYVMQTVVKLANSAKERRFASYLSLLSAQQRKETERLQLRKEWKDAIPYRLRLRFDGHKSTWVAQDRNHQARMALLMQQWIIIDKASQVEVEERLRFVTIEEGRKVAAEGTHTREEGGSFLAAVQNTEESVRGAREEELERLTALCKQPVMATTKLRKRTADEKKAIGMILNHDIEVLSIPPFLKLSMTPGELADFEDIFMSLEYPLYAHLEPGQRFYDNLTTTAILEQVNGGPEAAAAHVMKIDDFKNDLSRISVDNVTRTVKVTFKGRGKAAKWVGWTLPLAKRMLELIDYDMIRERAKRTHELVLQDYYSFTAEVRKGDLTSRGMLELLKGGIGLKVQELVHSASPTTGILERQWQVRVHSTGCPAQLRDKGYVVKGDVEIVLHHGDTYVNWPCRKCLAPGHPTRVCAGGDDTVEVQRRAATITLEREGGAERSSKERTGKQEVGARTRAKLEALLRSESREAATAADLEVKQGSTQRVGEATSVTRDLKGSVTETKVAGSQQQPAPSAASTMASKVEDTMEVSAGHEHAGVETSGGKGAATQGIRLQPDASELPPQDVVMAIERDEASAADGLDATTPEFGEGDADSDMTVADDKRPLKDLYAEAAKEVRLANRNKASTKTKTKRGRSPQRRPKRAGRLTSPCRKGKGPRSLNFTLAMDARETANRERFKLMEGNAGSEDEIPGIDKNTSLSPKRRADTRWQTGRESDDDTSKRSEEGQVGLATKTRSLSPKRRSREDGPSGSKIPMQQFMHQYLTAFTGKTEVDLNAAEREVKAEEERLRHETLTLLAEEQTYAHRRTEELTGWTEAAEERGFAVVKVTSPKDKGKSLAAWLELLQGTEVDVAANGHCGWLAYYAALYNKREGIAGPAAEVVVNANLLKKRVLNEMLANLIDEAKLHPEDIRAEAEACGCGPGNAPSDIERVRVVANHLAEQRAKSVRASVQMHYWVRPMHLKAMACHARETIYVLDVQESETARLQAYGYHEIQDASGDWIETGTVCPVPTEQATALLTDMVQAGIRPPVMILRWGPAGNHFQAVHYEASDYDNYAKNIALYAGVRNRILVEHGWKEMDTIEYDSVKTAHAAKDTLTKVRRQAKAANLADEMMEQKRGGGKEGLVQQQQSGGREEIPLLEEKPAAGVTRSLSVGSAGDTGDEGCQVLGHNRADDAAGIEAEGEEARPTQLPDMESNSTPEEEVTDDLRKQGSEAEARRAVDRS